MTSMPQNSLVLVRFCLILLSSRLSLILMFFYHQRQFNHLATLFLHTLSILHAWAALHYWDKNVQSVLNELVFDITPWQSSGSTLQQCYEEDVEFNSCFISCRHRQLRAMDELQERLLEEVHDQGGEWPSQLPMLLPNRSGVQHRRRIWCSNTERFPMERCQRAEREAGDLQAHSSLLHPLYADTGVHHAGSTALLLRWQHEAHHSRQRGRHT